MGFRKVHKKQKKSVCFKLEHNETFDYTEDPSVVAEDIWYVGDDYSLMKERSRSDAREWRRQGLSVLLKETFAYPHPGAQAYITAFVFLEENLSRRGLERSLSRHHGEERSEMKDRARQSVMIHQRRLQREGYKPDEMAEKLAVMYKEITRCACVFARRLGIADELVVKQGEDSSLASKIIDVYHKEKSSVHRKPGRRFSNASLASVISANSYDSRRFGSGGGGGCGGERRIHPKRCPSSPATPSEEFYAAIA